ncbi:MULTISPECIES: helix-turn-helix domain-containing protein [Streptomyces]|jgi:transcriptional regulator with XRE-family HTH domain|uniref:Transcriptional regulator with XRE-family HTH domain n=2 Tax=Streptomyces TaxID=1883 RepID=A0ABT9LJ85_STRGD|nr:MULTISPECIES: helix-turn-helix transcriptional regulator [Streptomyces]MDP9683768.1 transcriptional regulator with XRE-family HTH domain [Streptomyces griseoviridis]GGS92388.1 transcriptional regulator [Streptomyces griseoviridis]GGU22725.1 transcriptional regulator [Streptomyces daghestanicus]GHI31283.1 transcriptional regulator [Streptomyces daghestanicus]
MARRKDIDGSMSVPTFYGKELRWKREAAGLSLEGLLEGSFYGKSYLSDIEHGERRMPLDLARHVDRVLGTDKFFERNCEDVRRARRAGHAEYFEQVLEAEKHAKAIEEWCPSLFPGLLQTPAYARAVVLATHPQALDEEVEPRVSARMARAELFEADHHVPSYWAILHEALLLDPILPAPDMAEQLDRITGLAVRRRIVPQILPRTCGPHPFMVGTAKLMTFPDAPPLVYTESLHTGVTIDDPILVEEYRKSYDRLRAVALSPEASLAMIQAAAEDYRNGKQPDRLE